MIEFEKVWENGIVSFDTCCLGRMYEWEYRYAINIKDAVSFLNRMEKLWETEINVQEFLKQRKEIKESIYDQKYTKGIFKYLNKKPIPWNKIDGTMKRWESKGFSKEFQDEILKVYGKKILTEVEYTNIVDVSKNTWISIDLESLFDDILKSDGLSLSDDEKEKLQTRYNSGVMCPGSRDSGKKNGNRYNDLYIWELLKKKAKKEKLNIIFVTVDTKDDWFENGNPRSEYIDEFTTETGQEIIILTLSKFWEYCKTFLDISVDEFIKISSIREQLEEKYDDAYEEDICKQIEDLLYESDEIKDILENKIDCCVDMPVLDQLDETTIKNIEVIDVDDENAYIAVYLETEASFDALNYTSGENWSPGSGKVFLSITVSATIPVVWSSEDTERKVLADEVNVEDITEINVQDSNSSCDEEYEDDEYYEEYEDDGYYE